jgi:hypothetical protein
MKQTPEEEAAEAARIFSPVFSISPDGIYASLAGEDTPRSFISWEQLDQIRAEYDLSSGEELLAPSPSGECATRGEGVDQCRG